MATADVNDGGGDFQIRSVNSHSTVTIGKSEHGSYYDVRDMNGDLIKRREQVAGQGTLYIGNAYSNARVQIKKVAEQDVVESDALGKQVPERNLALTLRQLDEYQPDLSGEDELQIVVRMALAVENNEPFQAIEVARTAVGIDKAHDLLRIMYQETK